VSVRGQIAFDKLPLFVGDAELGVALLGPIRACEWKTLAPLYERQGLPKIDQIMGGRYVPAVKAFFDQQYNLSTLVPAAPDGIERPEAWTSRKRRA
jgi:hypothetical protein